MTQEELLNNLKELSKSSHTVGFCDDYKDTAQRILGLINLHVKEVIGDDEDSKFFTDDEMSKGEINKPVEWFSFRNDLREEQRKRAGLDMREVSNNEI